ncbi:MAG TPA: hypothetical protein VHS97_08820 [Isosphaeraceae bacterium]|nr:hypothetical protein [Isosphaeraceae bacterium]
MLRSDADALARGTVSWQARDDAIDVDSFIAAPDSPLPSNRSRDLRLQWIHFWGRAHMNGLMTGPRGASSVASVQFWEKLRPGRIEPVDLILKPDRDVLNVGADLGWLGRKPRNARSLRVRS